ncbi:MAG: hypothetical protein IRZ16_06515 [Myxococcaceae bacterium]|nr:hypothetical protein [Myxococcaceae bacterium]
MSMLLRTLAVAAFALVACDAYRPPALPTSNVETAPPDPLPDVETPAPISPEVQPVPPAPVQTQLTVTGDVSVDPPDAPTLHEANAITLRYGLVGARGTHQLRLELKTPAGAAYQVFEREIDAEPNTEAVAEFELPVAGTVIDTYNLAGVWTAHLFFDGRELTTRTFELQP